jgi:hypothetical protein
MMLAARLGLMVVPMIVWLAGSAALAWYVFVLPLNEYHCPKCKRALPRVEDVRPRIQFRCEPCGVDWDVERTGG